MSSAPREVVVAGHICLDLIPEITARRATMADLIVPGTLVNVGPVVAATGGAVANTGLALHRLGLPVRLVGKVGDDPFGRVILEIVRRHGESMARHMVVDSTTHSSYTVVISPPGIDRCFLHSPGANDTFAAADLHDEHLAGASLFHFGYPPLMRRFYSDDGAELAALLGRARAAGLVTSLDLAYPDPESPAGRAPWPTILRRALPQTDVFLPSLDELRVMLRGEVDLSADPLAMAGALAEWVIAAGCPVVVVKLGEGGLYLRTGPGVGAWCDRVGMDAARWSRRELLAPCFQANFVGATGAGDCTIAGFLAALADGPCTPEQALTLATAVGGCSVEAPDAIGGIRPLAETRARVAAGWARHAVQRAGWHGEDVYTGPLDGR